MAVDMLLKQFYLSRGVIHRYLSHRVALIGIRPYTHPATRMLQDNSSCSSNDWTFLNYAFILDVFRCYYILTLDIRKAPPAK